MLNFALHISKINMHVRKCDGIVTHNLTTDQLIAYVSTFKTLIPMVKYQLPIKQMLTNPNCLSNNNLVNHWNRSKSSVFINYGVVKMHVTQIARHVGSTLAQRGAERIHVVPTWGQWSFLPGVLVNLTWSWQFPESYYPSEQVWCQTLG